MQKTTFNKISKAVLIVAPVLSVIVFTACSPKPAPKAWSKEYISDLHNKLDKSFEVISDKDQRNQVINCVIEKVKKVLPNGLESVSRDSAHTVIVDAGHTCVHEVKNIKGVIEWTEYNETHLREAVLRTLDTPVCDCYISKLKSKYPDGLPLSQLTSEKRAMVKECDSEMKETKQAQDRIMKSMKK